MAGFTYKILPELMTFYAGYSEANRAPTPLELGCSNPLRPCLLEGFLVSDPPLNQVVARTREAGLRGNINTAGGRGDWKLGLFRTDSESDIIQVASVLQGRGVFQNVPATRRQGLEAGAQYQTPRYLVYANYAFVDATYQFTGLLASPNNPSADANGEVLVTPGKQIPGIPRHQVKGGLDYFVTPQLKLGTDVIWVGSQWYVGDAANQHVKLADYWVANLHGSYQLTKEVQIYGVVEESVQSEVRDLRHLFRSAGDRQRAPKSADRTPHHHSGAAALDLCRHARKAVMSTTQSERYPAKPVGCEGDAGNGGEVSRLIRRGFMTELGGGGVDFMRTECPTSSPRRFRFTVSTRSRRLFSGRPHAALQ